MKNSRRDFLKIAGLSGLGLSGAAPITAFASKNEFQPRSGQGEFVPLNRMPRTVHEYFVNRLRVIEEQSDKRHSQLKTKADAEAYVKEVREKIRKCFGEWPEKTPLNPKITGILKRDTYKIEKVIYESRPGFFVTANLFIPLKKKYPLPGVIFSCGHSDSGKIANQSIALDLVKHGYVVLSFDPIGQGERLQYLSADMKSKIGTGVPEHLLAGNQMTLLGESFPAWRAWDAIRSIDYLLTRKEVDKNHIGMTGASGGGTMTTWTCGLDRRITMAAPVCFVTTFLQNMENELPADSEQYPSGALAEGLDHSDFIAAMAPNPVILLGEEEDFFDIRGLEKSFLRLKNLYSLLGAEKNISISIGPNGHSYSREARGALYKWFNSVTKVSDLLAVPEPIMEKPEDLWCTPNGQVGLIKSATVFSITSKMAKDLSEKRTIKTSDQLKDSVHEILNMPEYNGVPHFRIMRYNRNRQYPKDFTTTYIVETEPGITLPLYRLDDTILYSRPRKGKKRAFLYISHLSADEELRNETFLRDIILNEKESAIFAFDVRGIGETRPNTCGDNFFSTYGSDYFYAGHSLMIKYPYVGQKTFDILRVISLLRDYGHNEIHMAGKGWGSIPATFAALLSDHVKQITIKNALTSYGIIAGSEEYNWPFSSFLPGVLKHFDLPECYKALESKKFLSIEPWGAMTDQKLTR